MSVNRVILLGRMGQDAEVKRGQYGEMVNLSIATSRPVKRGETWEDVTDWHPVKVTGPRSMETAKRLTKGALVYVEGELRHESWTAQDGQKRTRAVVSVTTNGTVKMESAPQQGTRPAPRPAQREPEFGFEPETPARRLAPESDFYSDDVPW